MRFIENIRESVRFTGSTLLDPIFRWIILFLFGIPWLVIPYVIDSTTIFNGMSFRWDLVPWHIVLPLIVLGIIGSFLLVGYTVRLFRGGTSPPGFDYPGDLFLDGIKLTVIGIIWILPAFVLLAGQLFLFLVIFPSLSGLLLMTILSFIILIFVLFVGLMSIVFGTIGGIRFARTGSVREAFAFSAISATISRIGFLYFIFCLIFLFVVAIFFLLVKTLFSFIPLAGPAVASFLSPVMEVFRSRFLTNVYDNGGIEVPAPSATSSDPVRAGPEHATSRTFFLWGLVLVAVLAVCASPFILAYGTLMPGLPAMTMTELDQVQNDDISVRSAEGYYSSPIFSGDGSRIYYVATTRPEGNAPSGGFTSYDWEEDIWVMTAKGEGQARITRIGDIKSIALDPQTDTVAFSRYENGTTSLILVKDHASGVVRFPNVLPHVYFSSFSPDGKHIAATGFNMTDYRGYMSGPDGTPVPSSNNEWSRLLVMDVDGMNVRELARTSVPTLRISAATETSWSPDGSYIVAPLYNESDMPLAVIDTTTGTMRNITRFTFSKGYPGSNNRPDPYPRWSPKGDLIAFIRDGNVWVIRPDGTGEQKIAGDGHVETLAWNPNATRIAFSADSYLGIVDPDGGNLNRVSNIRPGPLSWSPDGNTLVYAPGIGSRIRIMALTPGVLKMGEYTAQQMDRMMERYNSTDTK